MGALHDTGTEGSANKEDVGVLEGLAASRKGTSAVLAGLAAASAILPLLAPFAVAAGGVVAYSRWQYLHRLPFKLPAGSGPDRNQRSPADGRPSPAKGIFLLGHDKDEREIWLTDDDVRQHMLVTGTTGSGKTEGLLGFAANALSWGSGLVYIDGKGDVSIYARVFALAYQSGRLQDLMVLNFMSRSGASRSVTSMRLNPFAQGSAETLTHLVVSLMDDVGGDGAMWKGRASAMLAGVMRALCWLRDNRGQRLDTSVIRDHMNLRHMIALMDGSGIPEVHVSSIRAYLRSLPGYVEERGNKQPQTALDQHGYLEMQFTKILGSMADVYGHIFGDEGVDIDMNDVVLNRRILVVMLPALEKSPDEIANLGKIVLASLRAMMGAALGSSLDGSWEDVVQNKPGRGTSPFMCILDDVGYYTVRDTALMAAQGRTLGFSMVYSSQGIEDLRRIDEGEADKIIANTNTKVFMRTDELQKGLSPGRHFQPSDLCGMGSGEAVVVHGGNQVQARLLYVPPSVPPAEIQLRIVPLVAPIWDIPLPQDVNLQEQPA